MDRTAMDRTAFNKYNPDELLGALVDILDKYELDDAVSAVKEITPEVQQAWRARDRELEPRRRRRASADRVARRWLATTHSGQRPR